MTPERGPKGDHGQHGDAGEQGIQGEPGVTGAAGAEGRHGAAGAAGAAGTTGTTGERGPRGLPISTKAQLAVYVVIVAAFIFALYLSDVATDKAKVAAKRAETANTATQFQALSNCIRNNITSGVIAGNATLFRGREREVAERISSSLYPVLDCKASSLTGKTVLLAKAERDEYIHIIVANGRAPIVNDGKVVGSRATVLEGIQTIGEAGSVP